MAFAFTLQMASVVYHALVLERTFSWFFGVTYPLRVARTDELGELTPPMYATVGIGVGF